MVFLAREAGEAAGFLLSIIVDCRGARVTRCGPTERVGFPVIMVSSASLRPLNESPLAPRRFSQRVLLAYCFKGHCLWALSKVLDSVDYHVPEPYAITP